MKRLTWEAIINSGRYAGGFFLMNDTSGTQIAVVVQRIEERNGIIHIVTGDFICYAVGDKKRRQPSRIPLDTYAVSSAILPYEGNDMIIAELHDGQEVSVFPKAMRALTPLRAAKVEESLVA